MVRGRPDDPDGKPLDFITAAAACDVAPDRMRQWLDRAEARAFLRAERRAFRDAVCAGNELALKRVRDTSENGMAVIGSVRALEQLDEEKSVGVQQIPGFVIQIISPAAPPQTITPIPPAPLTIEPDADQVSAEDG
jgi:hypothetical protein